MPNQPPEKPSSTGAGSKAAPDRAPVLIVDDHPGNLLSLKTILDPLEQTVVAAGSGEAALREVLARDFAVILMDVRMPRLDGIKTAQLIRQREKSAQVPIIFLTAVPIDASEIMKAYEEGAVDFLLKPFDPAILRSKVKVFVDLYLKEEMIKHQAALLMQRDREAFERRSEMRFRSLLDSMPIAVLALRPDGAIYYCNRTVSDWVLASINERRDSSPLALVCAEDRERVAGAWDDALKRGKPLETQFRIQRKSDGEHRWYLCRIVPQRDEDGAISSWICAATDIDSQYEARAAAESANRMKDEFLATMSHELRNPLSAILGWTRLLRSGKLEAAKTARALETVERNAQSQAALIDDILDVARITRGKLHLNLGPVDMTQVTEAAVAAVRPLAEAREIALETAFAESQRLEVTGDSDRLQQVVRNLLSNAIKFSHHGGRVRVELAGNDKEAQLRVSDNGQGIDAGFLPHIFERFRQAESGATRVYAGLGIGLSISREIVELHRGTIHAHSEGKNTGATFTVCIPHRPRPMQTASRAAAAAFHGKLSLSGIKILLVDDEADAREMIAEALVEFGAEPALAASAQEALATITTRKPDVIISDIGMPVEDGYTLVRKIRQLAPNQGGLIPVCALTGWATPQEARRALAEGFQAFIRKPVELPDLVSTIYDLANGTYRGSGQITGLDAVERK